MNLYSDFDMAETFSRKLRLSHTFMNTYDHHCMITFLITTFKKHSNRYSQTQLNLPAGLVTDINKVCCRTESCCRMSKAQAKNESQMETS